ncbi:MAG TPA: helix-turn-helix domain-containing protein [Candidatus Acidoferrum sp.]|nr:helix-turn-helix domain-containing protein [Candidatus Acidoferrum sp.]
MTKHNDFGYLSRSNSGNLVSLVSKGSPDDLLTIHEVAVGLRVDDTTVRRWINNGVLDAVTLPHLGKRRGYRVKKGTLRELLNIAADA